MTPRPDRVLPAVTARLARGRDRKPPFSFTVRGTVDPPDGMTRAEACGDGDVEIEARRKRRTVASRRVRLRASCRFTARLAVRERARLGTGRLRIVVRWLGNDVLRPRAAPSLRARAG